MGSRAAGDLEQWRSGINHHKPQDFWGFGWLILERHRPRSPAASAWVLCTDRGGAREELGAERNNATGPLSVQTGGVAFVVIGLCEEPVKCEC